MVEQMGTQILLVALGGLSLVGIAGCLHSLELGRRNLVRYGIKQPWGITLMLRVAIVLNVIVIAYNGYGFAT